MLLYLYACILISQECGETGSCCTANLQNWNLDFLTYLHSHMLHLTYVWAVLACNSPSTLTHSTRP